MKSNIATNICVGPWWVSDLCGVELKWKNYTMIITSNIAQSIPAIPAMIASMQPPMAESIEPCD